MTFPSLEDFKENICIQQGPPENTSTPSPPDQDLLHLHKKGSLLTMVIRFDKDRHWKPTKNVE